MSNKTEVRIQKSGVRMLKAGIKGQRHIGTKGPAPKLVMARRAVP